jgi:transcriptional regulator with XRE-family HTH domain/ketosteroid isomerase-like protein
MKQPDLGKKISELRLAKGLTQGELAEQCKLGLRTIQRIESAEVTPRSYTVKLIFESLDYDIYNSFGKFSYKLDRAAYRIKIWLEQFHKYILDLFNLKTNTMKKIAILSVPGISIILCFLFMGVETQAQDNKKAKQTLTEFNSKFVDWFNTGQIDSIGLMYLENACMIPDSHQEIHGRENIKGYYSFLYASGFRFKENNSKYISVSDSIAVERGVWKADINNKMTGTYLTQWRLSDGKWYIENEMSNTDSGFRDEQFIE